MRLFWMLWIGPAFVFLWLVDSTEPGHALVFTVALSALGAGLLAATARTPSRLLGVGTLIAACQALVFLFAAPQFEKPLAWTVDSMLLNVTAPGLREQQASLDDALRAIRSTFDPAETVVVTVVGQDAYRFMMYYLPTYRVLRLDPQAQSVLPALGKHQGTWTQPADCLFGDVATSRSVRHAVWVVAANGEPGLIPDGATKVSSADNTGPFQVWDLPPPQARQRISASPSAATAPWVDRLQGAVEAEDNPEAVFDPAKRLRCHLAKEGDEAALVGRMHLLGQQEAAFRQTTLWRVHRYVQLNTTISSSKGHHHAQSRGPVVDLVSGYDQDWPRPHLLAPLEQARRVSEPHLTARRLGHARWPDRRRSLLKVQSPDPRLSVQRDRRATQPCARCTDEGCRVDGRSPPTDREARDTARPSPISELREDLVRPTGDAHRRACLRHTISLHICLHYCGYFSEVAGSSRRNEFRPGAQLGLNAGGVY